MTGCTFCRLLAGDLPAWIVAEDEAGVALLTAEPAARGHTLVVPRVHVEQLWDATADEAAAVMRLVHRTAVLLRERLAPDGLTLRQNNGPASGQRVPHVHVHLVPRWEGDGHIGWPSAAVHDGRDEILALLRG